MSFYAVSFAVKPILVDVRCYLCWIRWTCKPDKPSNILKRNSSNSLMTV